MLNNSGYHSGKHPRRQQFLASGLFDGPASFRELEQRIEQLGSEKDRGDAFEVFAEAYLATQKLQQAAEVWPENTAPVAVTKELRLPATDKGVDGVLQRLNGSYAAYQVKFRSGRPALSWTELSTFLGLADRAAQRILFTNSDGFAEVVAERRDFACIRGADLDRLTGDDLAAIAVWLRSGVYKAAPKTPREHQAKALADLELGLTDHDRVTAVMACGSGKTLVALWLAERREAKRILVLVPSLALIRQTLHEWLKETHWQAPRFLACCSVFKALIRVRLGRDSEARRHVETARQLGLKLVSAEHLYRLVVRTSPTLEADIATIRALYAETEPGA